MALSFSPIQRPSDPANSYRATLATDMYSIVSLKRQSGLQFIYQVGDGAVDRDGFIIRNNTINSPLLVTCNLPDFVESDSPVQFLIEPRAIIQVNLRLSNAALLNKAAQGQRVIDAPVQIFIEPTLTASLVFIDQTLAPL